MKAGAIAFGIGAVIGIALFVFAVLYTGLGRYVVDTTF